VSRPLLLVVSDEALDALAESPVAARETWCQRRHAELAAMGALPKVHAEALAALVANHNRYTNHGVRRG